MQLRKVATTSQIRSTTPGRFPKPRRSGRFRLAVGVALVGLLGALAAPSPAFAVHDVGLFELDANVHDQGAAGDDWSDIFANTDSSFVDTGIIADPSPQTIFTGGGSKDDLDVPQWKHKNGNVPRQG